ncbi:MAG: prenyltransferase [Novosphingobium sp.]
MQTLGVAAVVLATGRLTPSHYVIGVVMGWLLHLSTHYVNEYFDYAADIANEDYTSWTGGSRVLVEGALPRRVALIAGIGFSSLYAGIFLALYLVAPSVLGPNPSLLVSTAFMALAIAWMYSAPPIRFVRLGLGEVTVATVLCIMLPAGASIWQVGYVAPLIWWIAIPLFQIQVARMMIMNVPDARSDRETGKYTLVVRLGPARAAWLHNALQVSAYTCLVLLALVGKIPPIPAILLALTAPIAVRQMRRMANGDAEDRRRFQALASTALQHVILTALAAIVGILVQWGLAN